MEFEAPSMSNSTSLARSIIKQVIELGIEDVVLSPGSRNAPLSIAFYHAQKRGLIKLHVRIDERGAAFFALGISKVSGKYVPVVCTSGTAVANYFPAVLEAHHSDINLLLLTADRPARLRKTGSNQTTEQANIFGSFVRHAIDASDEFDLSKVLSEQGPVHINLQFDEPLISEDKSDWLADISIAPIKRQRQAAKEISVESSRCVVIVGHDRAGFSVAEIEAFAESIAAPLVSEDPLVFENAIAHGPILLSDKKARINLVPETLFVIGRTTLSRSINVYIQEAKKVIVIDPRTEHIDTLRTSDSIYREIPKVKKRVEPDLNWHALWKNYEALSAMALATLPEWCEAELAIVLAEELESDTALFISSSRPIRDLEAFAIPRSGLLTYANRGLAGIDGNISTALGISSKHSQTYALIGDLAFLHDISALANPTVDNLTIIVVDNDGGGIFSTLPQKNSEGFETIFGTPHGRDIAKIIASFGISCQTISNAKELHIALQRIDSGLHVIVAKMPDRKSTADNIENCLVNFSGLVREYISGNN
jgi:2-succinyl-5-enolpyruvyl-6-hydroxy-3-cyclohexene-1-carboxylate synthase